MIERRTVGRRTRVGAASVLAAMLAAGCVAAPGATTAPSPSASPASTPTTQPSAGPSAPATAPASASAGCGVSTWARGPRDLVLRIWIAGGFVPPGVDLTNTPVISVYGDGSVVSQGAQIMIYPGPLLPSLQVQKMNQAGMRRLLDAAAKAGLLERDQRYDSYGIADAPTTFFTFTADGCTHRISAYALSEAASAQGLDQETVDARAALLAFRNALTDLPALAGSANVSDGGVFKASAYRVVVREDAATTGAGGSPVTTVKWPLRGSLATFGDPLSAGAADTRCGSVDGADAAALTSIFEKANAETRFESGGRTYVLRVRQLLPDESGCRDDIVL